MAATTNNAPASVAGERRHETAEELAAHGRHRPSPGGAGGHGARRPDIQGLRFVAVGLVVLFHAGVPALAGGYVGVDVFFVISGFLITGIIARQLRSGRFDLLGFYANRARRLLPAAGVVVAVTCLLTRLVLPVTRYESTAKDALSSMLYFVNWRLAGQSVDYLQASAPPSPFQHFWSLSVEEQFYVVWPLLLALALVLVGRRRRAGRLGTAALATVIGAVLVASFVWAVHYTAAEPAKSYFVTPTRMWELALGGAVGLAVRHVHRVPVVVAAVLGWAGLAAILAAAFADDAATRFPSTPALVPTLGAALVLFAGQRAGRRGPGLLLNRRPATFIGDISYSLYLWHWPLMVIVASHYDDTLPLAIGLWIGLGSIVPAWLSYRLVERPAQRFRGFATRGAGLAMGATCMLVGAVAGLALQTTVSGASGPGVTFAADGTAKGADGQTVRLGAETLISDPGSGAPRNSFPSLQPSVVNAVNDVPEDSHCITFLDKDNDVTCNFGPANSKVTIALVGDSHAEEWIPALKVVAARYGWHVVTHVRQSCPFLSDAYVTLAGKYPYSKCKTWNDTVMQELVQQKPTLVLTSARYGYQTFVSGKPQSLAASKPTLVTAFTKSWAALADAGVPTAVLRDTPESRYDILGCVAEHTNHLSSCARPRAEMIPTGTPMELAQHAADASGHTVPTIDLNNYICPTSMCAPAIGGVLVYRDTGHITATYAATLADPLGAKLGELLGPSADADR